MTDVTHLTTAHNPKDTRILDKECKSLHENGYNTRIVCNNTERKEVDGIEFVPVTEVESRVDRWSSIPRILSISRSLESDVYHFHDPELVPVGVALSWLTDAAVVYDVHEEYSHVVSMRDWIPDWSTSLLSKLVPAVESISSTQFDGVVSVTDEIGEKFIKNADEVKTVRNFPAISKLPESNASVGTGFEHTLCYAGSISKNRGIIPMVKLVNELVNRGVDVGLLILGDWKNNVSRERVQSYLNREGIEENVEFCGYVEYEKMFEYLRSSDVGMALYNVEHCKYALPTKFFEYLYAGLPILTTPVPAADLLPDEFTAVVPEGDTEGSADRVIEVLNRSYDEERMELLIETEYDWESEADTLVDLYDSILE